MFGQAYPEVYGNGFGYSGYSGFPQYSFGGQANVLNGGYPSFATVQPAATQFAPQYAAQPFASHGAPFASPVDAFGLQALAPQQQQPRVVLYYFAGQGLAEVIRLVLAEAGIVWEEHLLRTKEQWLELQPTLPYGQTPALEIDGKRLVQSRAIVNYLAKRFGLNGKDEFEHYKVDEVLESVNDYHRDSPVSALWSRDPDFQAKVDAFPEKAMKKYFTIWSSYLRNGPNGLHVVGTDITAADFAVYHAIKYWQSFIENALEGFPVLTAFVEAIERRPNIAAYQQSPRFYPFKPSEEYRAEIDKILR